MHHSRSRAVSFSSLCAILLAAAVLRVYGSMNELWLDEVWSFSHAQSVRGFFDVFTIHHDNNHYLNTYYLSFLDGLAPFIVYRIPSLIAGIALLCIAAGDACKRSRTEAAVAALLLGFSSLLIESATNARGHTPMLLFGYLSFLTMERFLARPQLRTALLFSLCAVAAFLWHLTYLFLFLALFAWSVCRFFSEGASRDGAMRLFQCYAIPSAVLAVLYVSDIRHMGVGGAPFLTMEQFLRQTASLAVGAPLEGVVSVIAAFAVLIAVTYTAERLFAADRGRFVFLVVLFLGPVLILSVPYLFLLIARHLFGTSYLPLSPRHLMAPVFAFLLLLGRFLAGSLRRGGAERLLAVLLLAFVLIGNAGRDVALVRDGRDGRYLPTVRRMLQNAQADVVTVGSTMDFHAQVLLPYYASRVADPAQIRYVPSGEIEAGRLPDVYLVERFRQYGPPRPMLTLGPAHAAYRLDDGAPRSGVFWYLYRRACP